MPEIHEFDFPDGFDEPTQELIGQTLALFKARPDSPEEAISFYLRTGYGMGLSSGELLDYFAVSTPNIIEVAGLVGERGDPVIALYDELDEEFHRKA
jgi:hypothetical protein